MRVTRFAGLLGLILTISWSLLWAQEYSIRVEVSAALEKNAWFEVQSRNFRVAGNADTKQLRRFAVDLEEVRRQFLKLFPKNAVSTVPTTVLVFRNAKALQPFVELGDTPGGVYSDVDRNYVVLNAGEKKRRNVYHDYIHTLIGDHPLPLWLREGLAEYYGAIESERYLIGEGRTLLVGFPIYSHEKLLKDRSFLPLDELFAMNDRSAAFDEKNRKSVFLAESWALVHMLHTRGFDLLQRWVESLVGENPLPFGAVFQVELHLMEDALKDNIHTSRKTGWQYTRIPYCMCESSPLDWQQFNFDRVQSYVKDLGERKLTPAQVRFYAGDLLLHRGSLQQAEVYLEDAVRLTPDFAAAHASLGVLRIRQNRYDEAKEHIERALALGSDNPLPYLFYARLIRRDVPEPAQLSEDQLQNMQTALLKAVGFRPNLNEAVDMLSEVDSLRNKSRSCGTCVSNEYSETLGNDDQIREAQRNPPGPVAESDRNGR